MNFIDEEIIEMTKHARQKKRMENIENQLLHTDIVKAIKEGQLTIEDETIAFTEIGFYEDQIRMSIPAAFEEMEPELMDILRKLQPDADMLDIGIKEVNGVQIGYFDFITKALDTKVYSVIFLFIVGDNVATGSVNCLKKEMNVWKPIAYGMMDSISIVNKLDEEGVV
ncbi:hypothetical protein [Aneurinibacillus aneurinilyticus]|uniref:hypothetical protein n=1 Tax=Aneurinibacillus aneurinilyticus TaxID=1391 RepID=UPI0023F1AC59|nr:hypothetical protein [Aneurinibacillus aneurinilyticus]